MGSADALKLPICYAMIAIRGKQINSGSDISDELNATERASVDGDVKY